MKKILFAFIFLISLQNLYAVQLPRPLGKEKRFQTYVYNPNDVYRYTGYYYNQAYIEFEEGETPQTITMGDSVPWAQQVVGNKLFLKPIGDYPQTTMTIFTNKRIYYFELDALRPEDVDPNEIPFFIKFVYPSSEDKILTTNLLVLLP